MQWVSFFSADLANHLGEISFPLNYQSDEHNAPAVLAKQDGSWLVARTGHGETLGNEQGEIDVYHVSAQFEIVEKDKLILPSGATYVQLAQLDEQLYLMSRDDEQGWGMFVSEDNGKNWSGWLPLGQISGRAYMLMQTENFSQSEYPGLVFHLARHPLDDIQELSTVLLKPELQHRDDLGLKNALLQQTTERIYYNDKNENIRLLSALNREQNICYLYSDFYAASADKHWDLHFIGQDPDRNDSINLAIGQYVGRLGQTDYVTGASLKSCDLDEGGMIELFVAHQSTDSDSYQITSLILDSQTGNVVSEESLYQSENILYRPVYIPELDYLMFNETKEWHSYKDWQATQRVVKLP